MRRLRPKFLGRPSPAMIVASMALFIALGGTSYAVTRIDGSQIKNRSVSGGKLIKNSVRAAEIRENGLRVSEAVRADSAGNADALGGTGALAFPRNVEVVTAASPLGSQARRDVAATCPGTKLVIAGGAEVQATNEPIAISKTVPTGDGKSWVGQAFETTSTGADWILRVSAVCADR